MVRSHHGPPPRDPHAAGLRPQRRRRKPRARTQAFPVRARRFDQPMRLHRAERITRVGASHALILSRSNAIADTYDRTAKDAFHRVAIPETAARDSPCACRDPLSAPGTTRDPPPQPLVVRRRILRGFSRVTVPTDATCGRFPTDGRGIRPRRGRRDRRMLDPDPPRRPHGQGRAIRIRPDPGQEALRRSGSSDPGDRDDRETCRRRRDCRRERVAACAQSMRAFQARAFAVDAHRVRAARADHRDGRAHAQTAAMVAGLRGGPCAGPGGVGSCDRVPCRSAPCARPFRCGFAASCGFVHLRIAPAALLLGSGVAHRQTWPRTATIKARRADSAACAATAGSRRTRPPARR